MSYTELTNKTVVCRKSHLCGWCGQLIAKGETAQYRSYIFDGFTNDWEHPECYAAMITMDHREFPDGWTPGDFLRGSLEWA